MSGIGKMEKEKIEKRAEKVLEKYCDNPDTITYIDAVKLAKMFGFSVSESNALPAFEDGSITVTEPNLDKGGIIEKNILVNDDRSFEAKRFIIVHELAHYLLHYQCNGELFRHRENIKGKNTEENDADYFAACLLMPEKSFRRQYDLLRIGKTYKELVFELQKKFRTPFQSIERRISEVCQTRS